jgi:hypothetical protein
MEVVLSYLCDPKYLLSQKFRPFLITNSETKQDIPAVDDAKRIRSMPKQTSESQTLSGRVESSRLPPSPFQKTKQMDRKILNYDVVATTWYFKNRTWCESAGSIFILGGKKSLKRKWRLYFFFYWASALVNANRQTKVTLSIDERW